MSGDTIPLVPATPDPVNDEIRTLAEIMALEHPDPDLTVEDWEKFLLARTIESADVKSAGEDDKLIASSGTASRKLRRKQERQARYGRGTTLQYVGKGVVS